MSPVDSLVFLTFPSGTNPLQNLLGTNGEDGSTSIHEFLDVPQIEEATPPPVTSTVMAEGSLSMQEYFQEPKDPSAYDGEGDV